MTLAEVVPEPGMRSDVPPMISFWRSIRLRKAAIVLLWVMLASPAARIFAQDAAGGEGRLKFVVALFRHGIRPPLSGFACSTKPHSGKAWPTLPSWHAIPDQGPGWGNLTVHGKLLAKALGQYYARRYRDIIRPDGAGAYFWADVDERTQQTAQGLSAGLCANSPTRCAIRLEGKSSGKDPLFHPFAAGCGTPNYAALKRIADKIQEEQTAWFKQGPAGFQMLENTLNCQGERVSNGCPPSAQALTKCTSLTTAWERHKDTVTPGCDAPNCTNRGSDPLKWTGVFSYASGATEAFLLEFGNNMPMNQVAWDRAQLPEIGTMLGLHEFFFDKTQRESYIAKVQGSNLVREIIDDLERAAGGPVEGCPHGEPGSKFIALVGHDTNLASVGEMLQLNWQFDPPEFKNVPPEDALPAGALLFELRDRGPEGKPEFFVNISYVTLTPEQMRSYEPKKPLPEPVQVTVDCGVKPCNIPLGVFKQKARPQQEFLSSCTAGQQVCRPK